MAIHQTKRQTDLEKRLQILRRQVYGKQEFKVQSVSQTTSIPYDDIAFLYKDLLKTLFFSSIAIGAQILLFFLLRNHYLNINF
ncbi:MAG: hypothetical protein Q7R77_00525 [Candidatus Daviesbacteria bacterium]|nr:hypothetical protein [Candidatus Daviesbacteria bacterium]